MTEPPIRREPKDRRAGRGTLPRISGSFGGPEARSAPRSARPASASRPPQAARTWRQRRALLRTRNKRSDQRIDPRSSFHFIGVLSVVGFVSHCQERAGQRCGLGARRSRGYELFFASTGTPVRLTKSTMLSLPRNGPHFFSARRARAHERVNAISCSR